MTPPLTLTPTISASGVAKGAGATRECSCGLGKRVPTRKHWSFTGRETHWGYVFLIWTRDDGKRFARFVG